MSDFDGYLSGALRDIESRGLLRGLRVLDSPQQPETECDGRRLISFSSNDYLGLATHPALREAAQRALDEWGSGSGASRLVCGNHREHELLDQSLAEFKRTEAALTFSSGYAAALGTIPAVAGEGEGDVVILDKLCHASMVDAARLSGATLRVFPHNNLEKLESHLRWAREKSPSGRVLVLAESVYSMDGDRAPLAEIVELKDKFGAWLFLDEAHAVGVIGTNGRGLADDLGFGGRVEIQMGTLGKALGSHGAYVCGSRLLRDFLINRARSFIYSTSPPPHVAASARAAVELLASGQAEELRIRLWRNIEQLAGEVSSAPCESAIVPVIIGDEAAAVEAAAILLRDGFLAPAIRYPTVARGAARIRLTLSARHEPGQIADLARSLRSIARTEFSTGH